MKVIWLTVEEHNSGLNAIESTSLEVNGHTKGFVYWNTLERHWRCVPANGDGITVQSEAAARIALELLAS